MSTALLLSPQNQGAIPSKHLKTQEERKQNELQNKQQQKKDRKIFAANYAADILYHNGIPNTRLGRFLMSKYWLVLTNGKRAWLQLWVRHLYPESFYTTDQLKPECTLPKIRKSAHKRGLP